MLVYISTTFPLTHPLSPYFLSFNYFFQAFCLFLLQIETAEVRQERGEKVGGDMQQRAQAGIKPAAAAVRTQPWYGGRTPSPLSVLSPSAYKSPHVRVIRQCNELIFGLHAV